ncbi:MAG: NIPSNAP family protein [Acidobacteria bacterium]|nr:NIPSNAP family protein [Acidobacteriota bacterium]MDA1236500.1 NIPSNAP family protein [Acidobacteriota bacterium]
MKRLILSLLGLSLFAALLPAQQRQYLELRTYHLKAAEDLAAIDSYMEQALLPALKRQGVGPVGVFAKDDQEPDRTPNVYMLIPYDSIEQFTSLQEKLDADQTYQMAASGYFAAPRDTPRFARIESELLHSFKVWPQVKVPAQTASGKDRLFELRKYESHTERMGALKVEMFNSGEVPIFLDAGIQPVFMGRAMTGPNTPNLTYMTVFEDMPALETHWKAFSAHPDWKVLSGVEKYKGTVSKIHKTWLRPRPYSGL